MRRTSATLILLLAFASHANASDALQWSGFALLRASNEIQTGPLQQERMSGQVQIGIDWLPSPLFGGHIHLLARDNDDRARRGTFGIAEAYLEAKLQRGEQRLRLRGGAMFLPTSRENVDALWETAYTLTPSALNSWLGEEFRPIGIDAQYTRRGLMGGATVFRGNDTFGALPAARGWSLRDHWATLGEWIPVDPDYFTSVSAENDHRLGWSARAGWNDAHAMVQLTHIDNRSDALEYGRLFNWNTRFDIVSAEYTMNDWTVAAESGWGPTFLNVFGVNYTTKIRASYLLVSRRLPRGRVTIRGDAFSGRGHDHAVTLAYFFTPPGHFRPGIELVQMGGDRRAMVELRYSFAGH